MKVTRLAHDRNVRENIDVIDVEIGENRFRISEEFGELKINKSNLADGKDAMMIKPGVSNVITIS